MPQLTKQVFELKPTHATKMSIELIREGNGIFIKVLVDDKVTNEILMNIDEYKQFVEILRNSKFIHNKNNTL